VHRPLQSFERGIHEETRGKGRGSRGGERGIDSQLVSRLSTWFSTRKQAPVVETNSSPEGLAEVRKRVQRLEIDLQELQEQHEALKLQHQRLRGRITGGIRHGDDSETGAPGAPPPGSKAALRADARRLGLIKS